MQNSFAVGSLWAQRNDSAGPFTPQKFGVLQEVTIDFSRNLKPLTGSYRMPIAIGAGVEQITGKAKFARIKALPYADLFFGITPTTGQVLVAEDELGTVPGSVAYTVTVTNSANFVENLGVYYDDTGVDLQVGATASGAGVYTVSSGVYTFNVADANKKVRISYSYTSLTGSKITLTNQLLGVTPTFQAWFRGQYLSKQVVFKFNRCVSSKLSFPIKLEDWTIPEFDFSMCVDDSNTLGTISTAE